MRRIIFSFGQLGQQRIARMIDREYGTDLATQLGAGHYKVALESFARALNASPEYNSARGARKSWERPEESYKPQVVIPGLSISTETKATYSTSSVLRGYGRTENRAAKDYFGNLFSELRRNERIEKGSTGPAKIGFSFRELNTDGQGFFKVIDVSPSRTAQIRDNIGDAARRVSMFLGLG